MTPEIVKQWLGLSGAMLNANSRRFVITEGVKTLAISDTTLPKQRIDIKRILGKRAPAVRKVLSKPAEEIVGSDVFTLRGITSLTWLTRCAGPRRRPRRA